MTIETDRLLLRDYTVDDYEALYEIMSDPETMRHYPKPFDEEKTRNWIQWNLDNYRKYGFGLWAVILKDTGASGTAGLPCRVSTEKCFRKSGIISIKSIGEKGMGAKRRKQSGTGYFSIQNMKRYILI